MSLHLTVFFFFAVAVFKRASAMAVGMAMWVCCSVHCFGSDGNISTTVGWIGMKFCTGIHGPQNPADFGNPMAFPLAPP